MRAGDAVEVEGADGFWADEEWVFADCVGGVATDGSLEEAEGVGPGPVYRLTAEDEIEAAFAGSFGGGGSFGDSEGAGPRSTSIAFPFIAFAWVSTGVLPFIPITFALSLVRFLPGAKVEISGSKQDNKYTSVFFSPLLLRFFF